MDKNQFSTPLSLRNIQISDTFWKNEMELVRKEVIPYQWEALNDRVEGVAPSYCMRNFKIAGKMNKEKGRLGAAYVEPKYTFRGFESLPEDPDHLEDKFYGFVFQDTDFSKWIEAVGYSLTQHPDAELEKLADSAIDIVCEAQQEDGYLDTYYIINGKDMIFSNLRDHHELYCFGHLAEGAAAYYQATGKDKLLKAAERFADYIDSYFGPEDGKCKGYPGHEIAEMALVRLYEVTGKQKYLDLSAFFVEERGKKPYYFDKEEHPDVVDKSPEGIRYAYNQAHLPVREQKEAVGHAVRAVYLYSGMADVARLKNDDSLYEACERLWDNIVNQKMYITGGIGGTHIGEAFSFPYDLPNDTAYAETCASIGLVFFARRMLEMKPDAKYADVMERALYNGILSGMALDGKSFFYVNPLEVNPEACHKDERKFHVKPVRQKWFGCACCPPNIARLLSSIGSYAYTENDDTLFVHLYIGSTLTKKIGDREADINITSQFPWNGDVQIKVRAKDTGFKLALRIPGWCDNYQLADEESYEITQKNGYLYLSKAWTEEDVVDISFPMRARLMVCSAAVRENIGKAALMRGPVVYCLEEKDNGKNLHLLSVKPDTTFTVMEEQIAGTTIRKIQLNGSRMAAEDTPCNGLYSPLGTETREDVTLTYIPYYAWANRGENEMQVWTLVLQ
ncbi:MAG: glycoside hydrolase family 127 protein [Lachnospiraceae bacterium]|nr:glycoside hydrolase family 127 protein [Lachnospiraceae bacterium]